MLPEKKIFLRMKYYVKLHRSIKISGTDYFKMACTKRNCPGCKVCKSYKDDEENLDIFDFALSEDEMEQITSLDTGHTYATARNTGKAVTEFLEKANQYHV